MAQITHTRSRIGVTLAAVFALMLIGTGGFLLVRAHLFEARESQPQAPRQWQATDRDAVLVRPSSPEESTATKHEPPAPHPAGENPQVTVSGDLVLPADNTIFSAAYTGKLEKVRALIATDRTLISARDADQGATPLLWASVDGHLPVIQYLVSQGADVNAKGKMAWTALHRAAYAGNMPVVKYLVAHGAKVDAGDMTHGTALLKAVGRGHLETAAFLLAHGANVNTQETDAGLTPLHTAVVNKRADLVQLLLQHHANLTLRSRDGSTALQYADLTRQPKLVALLKQAGAKE